MVDVLAVNTFGIVYAGKNDRLCILTEEYGVLYPDRAWKNIHTGFCKITGMKDFGTYKFGTGTMIKSDGNFTDSTLSAIDARVSCYQQMQPRKKFEIIDIASDVYGDIKLIVVDKNIVIDVFGTIGGSLIYSTPRYVDLALLPASSDGTQYQYTKYAANIIHYTPVRNERCFVNTRNAAGPRIHGSFYAYDTMISGNIAVPDKYICPDLHSGEYTITGIWERDNLTICIVEPIIYTDVNDQDLVEYLNRTTGSGVCRAIGHIDDPIYGSFGVTLSVMEDRSLRIDDIYGCYSRSYDPYYCRSIKYENHDLFEELMRAPLLRVKYIGRSDLALGTWSLNSSIDEDLFYFDSLTEFNIKISGASYYVSNAYYGDLVDRAVAMNIVECTCINNNIEIIDVRWDNINDLNMFTGGEIRALADIISDVNDKAIKKVGSLSRKGKLMIDVK